MSRPPDPSTIIRLAAVADLSPKTIGRYFAGRPIRPRSFARIQAALTELGLPARAEAQPQEAASRGRVA